MPGLLRAIDVHPVYSMFLYDENDPGNLIVMPARDLACLEARLENSLQDPAILVPINVHLDDASMVSTKAWKSASLVQIQIAVAEPGFKGSESNNMIIALSPTTNISLKSLFDNLIQDLLNLQEEGFEAYDCVTGKVVKVKMPVCCVQGDLPAKGEIIPLTVFRADVFCSRDLYNKATDDGFNIKRSSETLRQQINEIKNTPLQVDKKRLGVQYGLDIKNLDTILTELNQFDLTKDLPADILHHFLLGWMKKTLHGIKRDSLSVADLDMMEKIILWKEYTTRTTSNALRTIASQVGRNIKALTQVVWYPFYLLLVYNPGAHRDLEAI